MDSAAPGKWTKARIARLAMRVLKGLGHASIFFWLTLPLVTLNTCAGPVVGFSGYQALAGVKVPAPDFGLSPADIPDYGQDWWVVGLMVLAIVGIGAAVRGGLVGALVGAGVDVAGLMVLQAAIGFYNLPPSAAQYWGTESGTGGGAIGLVFFGALVLDLLWVSAQSWSKYRRTRAAPESNRGEWLALALAATFFLVLIGLGILALGALVLFTAH
jgi:hypothetical protein